MNEHGDWLRGILAGVVSAAVITLAGLVAPPTLLGGLFRAITLAGVVCVAVAWVGRRRPSIRMFLVLGALMCIASVAEWQNPGWSGRDPLGTRPIEHFVAVATAAAAVLTVVMLWRGGAGRGARRR